MNSTFSHKLNAKINVKALKREELIIDQGHKKDHHPGCFIISDKEFVHIFDQKIADRL